jgi:hypothetical protein
VTDGGELAIPGVVPMNGRRLTASCAATSDKGFAIAGAGATDSGEIAIRGVGPTNGGRLTAPCAATSDKGFAVAGVVTASGAAARGKGLAMVIGLAIVTRTVSAPNAAAGSTGFLLAIAEVVIGYTGLAAATGGEALSTATPVMTAIAGRTVTAPNAVIGEK